MAIVKIENQKLVELTKTTFADEHIREASDLQKYIASSIEILDKDLFVICTEFSNWEDSKRRIDILCIDREANLVVIELKRTEDGGHMELQSLRYAAMVAGTQYQDIVQIHSEYLKKEGMKEIDGAVRILNFLGWEEPKEQDFANDVRIILISADFSKELTTSILWLNERDIDIQCVRIKPYKDINSLYLDIQQIIPLPEAADFQVKQKEKAAEERKARRETNKRDKTKYDITIQAEKKNKLNKREAMFFVIDSAINKVKINPEDLFELTGGNSAWSVIDEEVNKKEDFDEKCRKKNSKYDASRWFNKDEQLFRLNRKTYAYTNQHGGDMKSVIDKIFDKFPQMDGQIEISID